MRNVVVENSKVKTVGGRINKYMWSNQQGNGRINIHHSLSYIDIPAVVQYVTSHVINALYGSINKDESDSTIYITIPCALASKSKIYQVGGRITKPLPYRSCEIMLYTGRVRSCYIQVV